MTWQGPQEPHGLTLQREDNDLLFLAEPSDVDRALVVARHRDGLAPDPFDTCELAMPPEGRPAVLPVAPVWTRIPDFFTSENDHALAVLVSPDDHALERLGRAGPQQPCLAVRSLVWGRSDLGWATTSSELAHSRAYDEAARRARAAAAFPTDPDPDAIAAVLRRRGEAVVGPPSFAALPPADRDDARRAFVDAVAWDIALDGLVMSEVSHLAALRDALDALDPDGQLGRDFLLGLAQVFLERHPPGPRVGDPWRRLSVAAAWQKQSEHDPTYRLIGKYILADLGRHLESRLNDGSLPLDAHLLAQAARLVLRLEGVHLTTRPSTSRKALTAWLTGNFEYLLGRLWFRAQEELSDPTSGSGASYALHTTWSDGVHRYATVLENGSEIGHAFLFDATQIRVRYVQPESPASEGALGRRGTLRLVTAGAHVNDQQQTAGFSAVGGDVRNFLPASDADGLVWLGDDGLGVLDLRRGGRLPDLPRVVSPLRSLRDYDQLVRWVGRGKRSAFQTHLLHGDGHRRIDRSRASATRRERRLLVTSTYAGHPIVSVVDLPSGVQGHTLFEATEIVEGALETPESEGGPGHEVQAIANLDVGTFDIVHAWDGAGRRVHEGRVPLERAQNLLVFQAP